jgi:hypothetical protein
MKSVMWTYEQWLAPNIDDPYAKSLSITTGLLMEHVAARIESEGQALWDDNRDLRSVLIAISPAVPNVSAEIEEVLARRFVGEGEYPSVDKLVDEAESLRRVLTHSIDALWEHEDQCAHALVREYLSRQLMREARWMADVFVGKPRR